MLGKKRFADKLIYFFPAQKWNKNYTIDSKKEEKHEIYKKQAYAAHESFNVKKSHLLPASNSALLLSSLSSCAPSSNFLLNFSFLPDVTISNLFS